MYTRPIVILGIIFFLVSTTATLGHSQGADFFARQLQEAKNYNTNINVPYLTTWVMPSVVTIFVEDKEGDWLSQGSGFFVSPTDIITCYHVINVSNWDHISILMYVPYGAVLPESPAAPPQMCVPIESFEVPANISEIDADFDLARLSIQSPLGRALPINTTYPMMGEDVFAFGSPITHYFTVSRGILSGYCYPWELSVGASPSDLRENLFGYWNLSEQNPGAKKGILIQYNAPTSSGNSGGPLVNAKGEVIGVVDMNYNLSRAENMNYAVPSIWIISVMQKASTYTHQQNIYNPQQNLRGNIFSPQQKSF